MWITASRIKFMSKMSNFYGIEFYNHKYLKRNNNHYLDADCNPP